jgi:putative inorganic carbon (HCO3(-)) transporter
MNEQSVLDPRTIQAQQCAPSRRPFAARAYQLALPFVFLIVALLIFPSRLSVIGMIGVLALCGLRRAARDSPFPKLAINPLLLVFLILFAIALLFTPARDIAWMVASHLLAGIAILITIADHADTPERVLTAMGLTVLLGVIFALGAPFGADWSGADKFNLLQLTNSVPLLARPSNVNNVAGALEAAVPLSVCLIFARTRPWNIIGALALAPLSVMLVLLQSRGAWLAVLMGLVVYATLYRRWVLPLVPIVLLGGLFLNASFGEPIRIGTGDNAEHQVISLSDRTEIWQEAVRLSLRAPLLGNGVNGFAVYGKPVLGVPPNQYVFTNSHAHNLFLEIAVDVGWIGLLAFLGIVVIALRATWQSYRQSANTLSHTLAMGILAAFAVITTHGLFDTIYWGFKAEIFLWAAVGLALAIRQADSDVR